MTTASIATAALSGYGKSTDHYKRVENGLIRYYEEKYGDKVTVENSYVVGNYELFRCVGVKDSGYEISTV